MSAHARKPRRMIWWPGRPRRRIEPVRRVAVRTRATARHRACQLISMHTDNLTCTGDGERRRDGTSPRSPGAASEPRRWHPVRRRSARSASSGAGVRKQPWGRCDGIKPQAAHEERSFAVPGCAASAAKPRRWSSLQRVRRSAAEKDRPARHEPRHSCCTGRRPEAPPGSRDRSPALR